MGTWQTPKNQPQKLEKNEIEWKHCKETPRMHEKELKIKARKESKGWKW